jgi:hypothetical protein
MTGTLKYIFNASISDGPSESVKEEIEMNTYDVVNIKVQAGEEKQIRLLPDNTPNLGIKFFCITSDLYSSEEATDPNISELVYKIVSNAATPEEISIILDRPHVMIGKSILDKIGNFSKLKVKNGTESVNANVRILVGRDV